MVKSAEYHMKMMAEMHEAGFDESKEEELLWEKRGRMEKRIERKERMIYNAQERLNCGWKIGVFEKVEDEIGMMQEEIGRIRGEIALVDRKIRAAERKELEEGEEEAKAINLVAEEAKEYAYALGQARQRMKDEEKKICELEAKLKGVGRV